MTIIVLLSGPIAAGKSSLGDQLVRHLGATRVKTRELLAGRFPRLVKDRVGLQRAGDRLDRETTGQWIATAVAAMLASAPREGVPALIVVDSVRIHEQVHAFREAFGHAVFHVHVTANIQCLARRYAERHSSFEEVPQYADVRRNKTERHVEQLAPLADVVIETDRCTREDVFARVAARIRYRRREDTHLVDILVGGQYGSEGKGNIAHYLAPEYDVLVRVGGPNAGHKVFRRESPYTFHQLPSGALANSGATLVLGAGAVINVERLQKEIADLAVDFKRLVVDPQAMIIDPRDIAYEEGGLRNEIASTAQGVGAATARKVLRGKEFNVVLARDVPQLKHYIHDTVEYFANALQQGKRIMLEGTQGTLLSVHHGFYPHVTSRVTTATGCLAEAGLPASAVRRIIMVCRTYPIRVGDTDTGNTSGHMAQEIDLATIAARSGLPLEKLQEAERTSTTNRKRRIAEFDWLMFRRALALNGPTDIALTFVDYLAATNQNAFRYEQLTTETRRLIEEIEQVAKAPISLISTCFGERNIIDRRRW